MKKGFTSQGIDVWSREPFLLAVCSRSGQGRSVRTGSTNQRALRRCVAQIRLVERGGCLQTILMGIGIRRRVPDRTRSQTLFPFTALWNPPRLASVSSALSLHGPQMQLRRGEFQKAVAGLSRLSDRQESATIIVGGCSPAERVLPLSRFTPASPKAVRRFYGAAQPASISPPGGHLKPCAALPQR